MIIGRKNMSRAVWNHLTQSARVGTVAALALLLPLALQSCRRSQKAAGQKTFASPDEAGAALVAAAASPDRKDLIAIFGPASTAVLFTGDAVTDKARLNHFVTAYNQMHRWGEIKAGGQVLLVGPENIAFPVPLGKNSEGRWYFDTAAGKDEILARRIGKNELTAMDASEALAGAQHEYYKETHDGRANQYAQKFVSDPGKQNGLYWPVTAGQRPSPLGRLGDFATVPGSSNTQGETEFNGYRYRILTKGQSASGVRDYVVDGRMTRGFAILAYPVEYRKSGIVSFLIGQDGALYQKDFGENTANLASALTEFNPADGWTRTTTAANTASRVQQ
jgi:hypothetical protein